MKNQGLALSVSQGGLLKADRYKIYHESIFLYRKPKVFSKLLNESIVIAARISGMTFEFFMVERIYNTFSILTYLFI